MPRPLPEELHVSGWNMCGIAGWFDFTGSERGREVQERMTAQLLHRGPDSRGYFSEGGLSLGFRRLSIVDLVTGDQPLFSEDGNLVLVCNGEIFNHRELAAELKSKGHVFRTASDVEVLLHLYEEHGVDLLDRVNGQFGFALYDRRQRRLFLARDPFGINPLFYSLQDGLLLFGSEIKAILAHPRAPREVDLTGLDQVLSFPGLVPPRTLFKGINCLEPGHFLLADRAGTQLREYWDLIYPEVGDEPLPLPEPEAVEALREQLARAVRLRLQGDVPVGLYLSGGLDSSLIGALIRRESPEPRHSFSVTFPEQELTEAPFQRLVVGALGLCHHETAFSWEEICERLQAMVYHGECPVKETFDTCALALSEAARRAGVPVVLAGQGADELFGGYMGYRFDRAGLRRFEELDPDAVEEGEIRARLWGDADLFYEIDFLPLRDVKMALYSRELAASLGEFDATSFPLVNGERLRGRHPLHQRSYLDCKLRLSEHLLSEHGDRMALANSVEARFPFLDPEVVALAVRLSPELKVSQWSEKYILKRAAEGLLPQAIIDREKFGFRAPGTPYLLQQGVEWIEDLLSYDRIRAQGFFNPDTVEKLKSLYRRPGFSLNPHLETDLLMIVLTFGILVDRFRLSTGAA